MADLTGTSGADNIPGTADADVIRGLAGNDTLRGAGGADTLFGGFGNGQPGSGADQLRGGGGNDVLDGEDGNDVAQGDSGNDVIVAGRGNDEIDGGSGNDSVIAAGTLDEYGFRFSSGALRMTDEVAGRDGRDRMKHVETILFDDGYRLSLTGGNNNPYAVADAASTTDKAPVLIDVLANDFDPDTTIFGKVSTLSLVSVSRTTNGGTATISDGKILYDPGEALDFILSAGDTATDSFNYRITDGKGGFWTTTVTVTIDGTGTTPGIELSSLDGTNGFRLDGVASLDFSGTSVASAGDVNGDGFDDVIVGATGADPGGGYSGAGYVVFGKEGGFAPSLNLATLDGKTGFRLDGVASLDFTGASVASAGDVNGDGFDDIIIGAPRSSLSPYGSSYVVFGKPDGFTASLDLASLDGDIGFRLDRAGYSVASAGDVNGDGFGDLIVGEPSAGGHLGFTYVVFGKSTGFDPSLDLLTLNGTTGFRLVGTMLGERTGTSVASIGDFNGDGFDDLIIGGPSVDTDAPGSGAGYVVFGKSGGFDPILEFSTLDGTNGFRLDGVAQFDRAGRYVASAGDMNNDGFDDLIIGTAESTGNNGAYVVFGRGGDFAATLDLAALNGANGFHLDGIVGRDYIGPVASAGDVNGDGFDDIIVGTPGAQPSGTTSGASFVIFGKAGGFDALLDLSTIDGVTNGFRLDGVAKGDVSGGSVASAGDVNGDGFADVIIGARQADPNGESSGASYVVFGGNLAASASRPVPSLGIADVLDIAGGAADLQIGDLDGTAALAASGHGANLIAGQSWPHFHSDQAALPVDLESGP